jgi:phosphoribosylformimino-5-aminoimidazole carboxamide ribotide isomerase
MSTFHIYPAIDIQDGKCVRLLRGDFAQATIYHDDPLEAARRWRSLGAGRLHVVDLDGARTGQPVNAGIIGRMAEEMDIPIQCGGGIRNLETLEDYLAKGVTWVVLGTKAVTEPGLLSQAVSRHPGKVVAGLDLREGKASLEGWVRQDDRDVASQLAEWRALGLQRVVVTDINRDGTLDGVDPQGLLDLTGASGLEVIASGGVATLDDLSALRELAGRGIIGAIVGKALYNGNINLEEALELESD